MWTGSSDIDRVFGAMDLLRSRMNRLFADFDRSYGNDLGWYQRDTVPPTNLYDAGDHLELIAEVPGMGKDDLNVRLQGNYLEISGSRKVDAPEGYKTHRSERGMTTFTRGFTLPAQVDAEKIEATLKDGLLTLVLPKPESAKPKLITIN